MKRSGVVLCYCVTFGSRLLLHQAAWCTGWLNGNAVTDARRLTVLQVLPALASGGVERGTLEIADYLVQCGHRSLVMSAGGRMVAALEAAGSQHLTWPIGRKSLWILGLIPRLRQLLLQERVDIVHVRSRFPAWMVYLAWRGMDPAHRPRLVSTVHGCYSIGWYSSIMTCGEQVIVISSMMRDYTMRAYHVHVSRLQLIFRGVDLCQYFPGYQPESAWLQAWYAEYPHTRDQALLVLPARVTRWKGQEDFIRLLACVCQHRQDVHALIVCEVDIRKRHYAQALQQQIAAAGLCARVTITGHRQDLRNILAMARIVYSLSTEPEAFGRGSLEALSLGIPVIGYNHGGVAEQLAALLPAGAVEVGNVTEAAILTLNWLAQPPQVVANTQFTLQQMQAQTMAVYQRVMALPREGVCISP